MECGFNREVLPALTWRSSHGQAGSGPLRLRGVFQSGRTTLGVPDDETDIAA